MSGQTAFTGVQNVTLQTSSTIKTNKQKVKLIIVQQWIYISIIVLRTHAHLLDIIIYYFLELKLAL